VGNAVPFSKPVEDSVPKVDNAIAVGEDLDFQRKWWRFERIAWVLFGVIILCDVLGLFGRGYLANAERRTGDGSVDLKYERVERASTPSIMTFRFGPSAVHDGRIRLFVSEDVVKALGAQRISPQPAESVVGGGGITYTFPASDPDAVVEIMLEPSFPGVHSFEVGVPGSEMVREKVAVVP
jgi:hypothetical protein